MMIEIDADDGGIDYKCPNCKYLVIPLPCNSWEELNNISFEELVERRKKMKNRLG